MEVAEVVLVLANEAVKEGVAAVPCEATEIRDHEEVPFLVAVLAAFRMWAQLNKRSVILEGVRRDWWCVKNGLIVT